MTEYKDIPTQELLDLATESSSELGSLGKLLFDYETGNAITMISEQSAMFLASARSIVLELVRRLHLSEKTASTYQSWYNEITEEIHEIHRILKAKDDR